MVWIWYLVKKYGGEESMNTNLAKQDVSGAKVDSLARPDALSAMLRSHQNAIKAVDSVISDIDEAAGLIADALRNNARLYYVGAGSSGLMAFADSCELPGTFRIPDSQIRMCMAGGIPVEGSMPGYTEDDISDGEAEASSLSEGDVAIVVSASGSTPYTLAFSQIAKKQGAKVIAIANVAGSELLSLGDVAIVLSTGVEVVEGSTRLAAGTAQKIALNMMSTQVGILMGHVHDGLMVNLHVDNIKLQQRATTIVSKLTNVDVTKAEHALRVAEYDTKLAVLLALEVDETGARALLQKCGGRLRDCLLLINNNTKKQ